MRFSRRQIGFWLGLVLFAGLLAAPLDPQRPAVAPMAAVAALMAVWWITEAIPIPITSLLPVVLMPVLRIMSGRDVAALYFNTYIFLFTGGFIIALAMQKWQLHRRLALTIIALIGSRPRRIVLGFMLATAFLSMWISNTATAMMMLPIGMSVIEVIRRREQSRSAGGGEINGVGGRPAAETGATPSAPGGGGGRPRGLVNFEFNLMLAIAYGASIGGVATLIGTPPNLVLTKVYEIEFPGAPPIGFAPWMAMGVVLSAVFLLVAWGVLNWVVYPTGGERFFEGRRIIRAELAKLGPMSRPERRVLAIFAATVALWITREGFAMTVGGATISLPGWSAPLGLKTWVDDGTVAMAMAILLFVLPGGRRRGEALIDWETAVKLPWGILLLFGGGFALAGGFEASGLSQWLGVRLNALTGAPPVLMAGAVSTMVTFLTELTSNTATTNIILPVIASLARATNTPPLLLMIPATLSASFAFMLPVATPPNAIVFGSGCVPIQKMAVAGLVLNLIGVVLTLLVTFFLAAPIFGL
ncbi:MAG: SLC13 family permease [Candidatus Sumerlaeia bacterium]